MGRSIPLELDLSADTPYAGKGAEGNAADSLLSGSLSAARLEAFGL